MTDLMKFLIIFGIIFIILWWINHTKIERKLLGGLIMSYGIMVATPFYPDFDLPFFLIYLNYHGIGQMPIAQFISQFPQLYAHYIILAIIGGILISLIGMSIAGISLKGLYRKFKRSMGL